MNNEVTIKVKRKNTMAAFLRPYRIFIDDKRMESIMSGQEVSLTIAPGRHKIDLNYSLWMKSERIEFDCRDGDTLTFECGFNYKLLVIYVVGIFVLQLAVRFTALIPGLHGLIVLTPFISIIMVIAFFYSTTKRGSMCYLKPTSPGMIIVKPGLPADT